MSNVISDQLVQRPWMAGFDAVVAKAWMDGERTPPRRVALEVGIFTCGRCTDKGFGLNSEPFSSGCQNSQDRILEETFGTSYGNADDPLHLVERYMAGAKAAAEAVGIINPQPQGEAHV